MRSSYTLSSKPAPAKTFQKQHSRARSISRLVDYDSSCNTTLHATDACITSGILLLIVYTQGKYKYNAWKKVVEDKTSPEDAQKKYVTLVTKLKGTYGFEA